MDIRHLVYFSEVAKQLSFTKAAATLHVSQPSLSKAIKNIEEELGVPLFFRGSKHIELTDAGHAVLINARQVLQAFKNLTSELEDITSFKKGEIHIGIPPIVGATFFSTIISQFKATYPFIHLNLSEFGTKNIKQGVMDGSLDIGLICNLPSDNEHFDIIKILNDPLMLVVHHENPLAQKKNVSISDLEHESFIFYRNDFSLYDRIIEECSKHGFSPNIVCESSQKEFMIEMVKGKIGVALLPRKICRNIAEQDIIALDLHLTSLKLEMGMIWKKSRYLPFSVREFVRMSGEMFIQTPVESD
ncbi:LysR family transcriptional regulator [Bacillus sp. JJ1562]|uniref:LysR family transcriptional regulator n=1 Tax=Bacillus sp. JJ1562 TaxID=3122960 RepID=UPI0030017586